MLNLVNRAPHSIVSVVGEQTYRQQCGLLTSVGSRHHPNNAIAYGARWALDNDCFKTYKPQAIYRTLARYAGLPNCLFAVVPDVPRDAEATALLFNAWLGTYQRFGYPVAFVAQDGIEHTRIPYDSFDVLFIGGSNQFKYSKVLRDVVAEAKRRGKWVHHGRVNTRERIVYSTLIGCDSYDGTHYTIEPSEVKKHLGYIGWKQHLLWEDTCAS